VARTFCPTVIMVDPPGTRQRRLRPRPVHEQRGAASTDHSSWRLPGRTTNSPSRETSWKLCSYEVSPATQPPNRLKTAVRPVFSLVVGLAGLEPGTHPYQQMQGTAVL